MEKFPSLKSQLDVAPPTENCSKSKVKGAHPTVVSTLKNATKSLGNIVTVSTVVSVPHSLVTAIVMV